MDSNAPDSSTPKRRCIHRESTSRDTSMTFSQRCSQFTTMLELLSYDLRNEICRFCPFWITIRMISQFSTRVGVCVRPGRFLVDSQVMRGGEGCFSLEILSGMPTDWTTDGIHRYIRCLYGFYRRDVCRMVFLFVRNWRFVLFDDDRRRMNPCPLNFWFLLPPSRPSPRSEIDTLEFRHHNRVVRPSSMISARNVVLNRMHFQSSTHCASANGVLRFLGGSTVDILRSTENLDAKFDILRVEFLQLEANDLILNSLARWPIKRLMFEDAFLDGLAQRHDGMKILEGFSFPGTLSRYVLMSMENVANLRFDIDGNCDSWIGLSDLLQYGKMKKLELEIRRWPTNLREGFMLRSTSLQHVGLRVMTLSPNCLGIFAGCSSVGSLGIAPRRFSSSVVPHLCCDSILATFSNLKNCRYVVPTRGSLLRLVAEKTFPSYCSRVRWLHLTCSCVFPTLEDALFLCHHVDYLRFCPQHLSPRGGIAFVKTLLSSLVGANCPFRIKRIELFQREQSIGFRQEDGNEIQSLFNKLRLHEVCLTSEVGEYILFCTEVSVG